MQRDSSTYCDEPTEQADYAQWLQVLPLTSGLEHTGFQAPAYNVHKMKGLACITHPAQHIGIVGASSAFHWMPDLLSCSMQLLIMLDLYMCTGPCLLSCTTLINCKHHWAPTVQHHGTYKATFNLTKLCQP